MVSLRPIEFWTVWLLEIEEFKDMLEARYQLGKVIRLFEVRLF